MSRIRFAAAFLSCLLAVSVAPSQVPPPPKPAAAAGPPRLEAIAETRLLMEGLNKPNFDGLGKHLGEKPADVAKWTFARGQALIVAETGNLLMMRPPKGKPAQEAWMARAGELRTAAAALAKACGDKDYPAAREQYTAVANACNRCHEAFGEKTRVVPFGEQ